MTSPATAPSANLGFLTILREPCGYVGGYLITNAWGRPLEFRLTSAVQPNKVQQILYGDALEPYLCAELIGKTLVEKSTTPVQVVVTDLPAALDLRTKMDLPIVLYTGDLDEPAGDTQFIVQANLHCHGQFPQDVELLRTVFQPLASFDWGEPFVRIREAIAEARKMGVAQRAA
jgi:hypothetical protein